MFFWPDARGPGVANSSLPSTPLPTWKSDPGSAEGSQTPSKPAKRQTPKEKEPAASSPQIPKDVPAADNRKPKGERTSSGERPRPSDDENPGNSPRQSPKGSAKAKIVQKEDVLLLEEQVRRSEAQKKTSSPPSSSSSSPFSQEPTAEVPWPSGRHPALRMLLDSAAGESVHYMPPVAPELQGAFARFVERQKANLEIMKSGQTLSKIRLVRCTPTAQTGNRIRYAIACFLYALVSDRGLAVDFREGNYAALEDLFELPVPIDAHHFAAAFSAESVRLGWPDGVEMMACGDLAGSACAAVPIVAFSTSAYYFAPHIMSNPHLQSLLQSWFPNGRPAEALSWFLLPPHQEVWNILRYLWTNTKLAEAPYVHGMQMRSNSPPAPHTYITDKEYASFAECALHETPASLVDGSLWYVAADSGQAIQESMKLLDGKHAFFRWKPNEFKLSGNVDGLRHAMADVFMMALADDLLICPWSSYGQMAAAFHLRPALWVSDYGDPDGDDYAGMKRVVDLCYRLPTTEYSAREYRSWQSRASCFKPEMVEQSHNPPA